jgi:hypothetical protein
MSVSSSKRAMLQIHQELAPLARSCESTTMHVASTIAPTITEPLTWSEICERYPDEWVCLVEIDRIEPNHFAFRSARVVGHGKTRRAPFEQAEPWWEHYDQIGHYFTGRIIAPFPRAVV